MIRVIYSVADRLWKFASLQLRVVGSGWRPACRGAGLPAQWRSRALTWGTREFQPDVRGARYRPSSFVMRRLLFSAVVAIPCGSVALQLNGASHDTQPLN